MKTDAMILMYNFKEDERTRQILRYLNIAGISCKTVSVTDYLHPLGYLFGLPGFFSFSTVQPGREFYR